ncbi:amylovoran biosynthesis protein AmsE [Photobacterium leiognathi subsp. mandapamensis]|uniref:glycosyltransferase n=1 Tax=Photobacterium leiognathi TaxID=553611 RepID=UPI000D16DE49|nr:glycosyltransferase [Photobacterium leiognathi]PSU96064.1 amylovoran biosynthesis protein AmsE [Photobacterium leiognathi subsp. mandapamensis]
MGNFSVLMSLYSGEKAQYFKEAMQSIYCQTMKPSEIIIVHDGPLNSSLYNVINEWKLLLPIEEVILDINVGLGNALNIGLDKCKNDLVARVDTDDINLPNRFEIQYKYMCDNLDVSLCGSHISEFDNNHEDIISTRKVPIGNEIAKFIFKRNPFNHMSVMYRKSAVLDSGSYQHLKFMEDYYLWIRMYLKGYKLVNLDMILVNARIGNGMLERRKGLDYYKSELRFMKYLLNADVPNKPRIAGRFLIRSHIRLLPKSLLRRVYKITRK